jgi:rare lipoprotein A
MLIIPLIALNAGAGPGVATSASRRASGVEVRTAAAAAATMATVLPADELAAAGVGVDPATTAVSARDLPSEPTTSVAGPGSTVRSAGLAVTPVTQSGTAGTTAPQRAAATTTGPPTTSAPTTTAAPTTAAPTTTTTEAPRPSQTGPASWYDAAAGTCAHKTLPFGTVVTIVDLDNGNTTTCRVDDRGPYEGARIIDLAPDVFGKLAPVSQGVINVRISW